MVRFLATTLFCEGREDARFLGMVIGRQLTELSSASSGFSTDEVVPQGCRTIQDGDLVRAAVSAAMKDFDLVFVHNDDNERLKIDRLREKTAGSAPANCRLVGVVPVRETEAWILADPVAFPRGSRVDVVPTRAADVEAAPNPKSVLRRALSRTLNEPIAEFIGERISLDRLALVPAYQAFLADLTSALKELHYL